MAETGALDSRVAPRQSALLLVLLAVSVALNLALLAAVTLGRASSTAAPAASPVAFSRAGWYAVWVSSKEAFVGHLTDVNGSDISMADIYYVTLEANGADGKPLPNPKPEDLRPTLRKLGNEYWGPKDFVRINRQSLQYYVELRADSPIVQAINKFEKSGQPPPPAQPAPSPSH